MRPQGTRAGDGGSRQRRARCATLKDAVLRTLQAAEIAGLRALAVHAKDDGARAFYERYGFVPSSTDAYHLLVLLKDVKKDLGIPDTFTPDHTDDLRLCR